MNGGASYAMGSTSLIPKISTGGRDNRICSKISEGSSDTERGHIADSMRGGRWDC